MKNVVTESNKTLTDICKKLDSVGVKTNKKNETTGTDVVSLEDRVKRLEDRAMDGTSAGNGATNLFVLNNTRRTTTRTPFVPTLNVNGGVLPSLKI